MLIASLPSFIPTFLLFPVPLSIQFKNPKEKRKMRNLQYPFKRICVLNNRTNQQKVSSSAIVFNLWQHSLSVVSLITVTIIIVVVVVTTTINDLLFFFLLPRLLLLYLFLLVVLCLITISNIIQTHFLLLLLSSHQR